MRLLLVALVCFCSIGAMESDVEVFDEMNAAEWLENDNISPLSAFNRFLFLQSMQAENTEESLS